MPSSGIIHLDTATSLVVHVYKLHDDCTEATHRQCDSDSDGTDDMHPDTIGNQTSSSSSSSSSSSTYWTLPARSLDGLWERCRMSSSL